MERHPKGYDALSAGIEADEISLRDSASDTHGLTLLL